jgi:hypothetical protein
MPRYHPDLDANRPEPQPGPPERRERRTASRVRDDQRSGRGSASALSRHKMLERKLGVAVRVRYGPPDRDVH